METHDQLIQRLMQRADACTASTRISEADALEFRREQYGLSASEFAQILNIQKSHYSETISGKRRLPINAVARAIAVDVLPGPLLSGRRKAAQAAAKEGAA